MTSPELRLTPISGTAATDSITVFVIAAGTRTTTTTTTTTTKAVAAAATTMFVASDPPPNPSPSPSSPYYGVELDDGDTVVHALMPFVDMLNHRFVSYLECIRAFDYITEQPRHHPTNQPTTSPPYKPPLRPRLMAGAAASMSFRGWARSRAAGRAPKEREGAEEDE